MDAQICLGVADGNPGSRELRRNHVIGLLAPFGQLHREVVGDGLCAIAAVAGEKVVQLGRIFGQVVEFPVGVDPSTPTV